MHAHKHICTYKGININNQIHMQNIVLFVDQISVGGLGMGGG